MHPLNLGHLQCSHLPKITGQHKKKCTGEKLKESEEQMGWWEGKQHILTNSYGYFIYLQLGALKMEGRV